MTSDVMKRAVEILKLQADDRLLGDYGRWTQKERLAAVYAWRLAESGFSFTYDNRHETEWSASWDFVEESIRNPHNYITRMMQRKFPKNAEMEMKVKTLIRFALIGAYMILKNQGMTV